MSRLQWNVDGKRIYHTGVQNTVLYVKEGNAYPKGVAWEGVTSVNLAKSGADASALYANNVKYGETRSTETASLTIACYDTPLEFDDCDGTVEVVPGMRAGQQTRKPFGFSYVEFNGNDEKGIDYGKTIYVVYNCVASPSARENSSINESTEAMSLSYEVTTSAVNIPDAKPSSWIKFDSNVLSAKQWQALEDTLYGTESEEAKLPLPAELKTILETANG